VGSKSYTKNRKFIFDQFVLGVLVLKIATHNTILCSKLRNEAVSSAGAGAVNTALFIQNAVQLRNMMLIKCPAEPNGVENVQKTFRDCMDVHMEILMWLTLASLVMQLCYAVFLVVGNIMIVNTLFLMFLDNLYIYLENFIQETFG